MIDALKRLYPNLSLVKRSEQYKLLAIQRLLEERDSSILADNMRKLEDRAYMSSHQASFDYGHETSSISRRVEEMQERLRIENSEKLIQNFDYDLSLMANVDLIDLERHL